MDKHKNTVHSFVPATQAVLLSKPTPVGSVKLSESS